MPASETIWLQRFPNGTFINWGRHGSGAYRGYGPALLYSGEAAKIMALVLQSMEPKP